LHVPVGPGATASLKVSGGEAASFYRHWPFGCQAGLRGGGWKTCHVPRRTWRDSKIDMFLELAASAMHLDRQRAGELITGQVRAVAALMSITEATARTYLGDEIIKDMARRMLFEVAGERPGADLMEVLVLQSGFVI
jgi:hypothetical protein